MYSQPQANNLTKTAHTNFPKATHTNLDFRSMLLFFDLQTDTQIPKMYHFLEKTSKSNSRKVLHYEAIKLQC